jgi:hypothetical protein
MPRCAVIIFEVVAAYPYCHTSLEPRRLVLIYGIIVPYKVYYRQYTLCYCMFVNVTWFDSWSGRARAMCAALSVGTYCNTQQDANREDSRYIAYE